MKCTAVKTVGLFADFQVATAARLDAPSSAQSRELGGVRRGDRAGPGAINGAGDNGDNVIVGNSSSNVIYGNGGADTTLNKASSSAHAAVESIAPAADEAARKVKPAIEQAAAMAHQAVDKAADAAAPTAKWLAEQAESLDARQKKLTADTSGYIAANPLTAVGIAVLAGFLISRVLR